MSSEELPSMRWDLLERQPPTGGERLTARLAFPSKSSDVFIAADAARRRCVLVRVPESEKCSIAERTSVGISVQTVEMRVDGRPAEVFIEVICMDAFGRDALDSIAIDVAEALASGATILRARLVMGILAKWRRFWSGVPQNVLSREMQVGLFGELWFLASWLMPAVDVEASISMWRGPTGSRNDFELPGVAVEVKTTARVDGSHQISGLEQLLEPAGGTLFLFSLIVREEASATHTLPSLVAGLRQKLSLALGDLAQFDAMLRAADYDDAHAPEYERTRFRIRSEALYQVHGAFPRLIPQSLRAEVPLGVGDVKYQLRLDAAGPWMVGTNSSSAAGVLRSTILPESGI